MKMSSPKECDPGREVPEGLFKDVKYFIVGSVEANVASLLNKGGATEESYLTDMVTHAIADDDAEYNFSEAKDLYEIPVVTSQWVLLSIRCACLLPDGFSAEATQIFHGVVACPSQLSSSDNKMLWAMINYYGGRCTTILDNTVTHLIIGEAVGLKYETALQHPEEVRIVNPDWVLDCIQEKQFLSESRYHPRLILSDEQILESFNLKTEIKEELDPYGMPMSPPITVPTSTNLIFKSDSTRTKEALARMVSNRMINQSGNVRPLMDPALLMKNTMDFAPPLDVLSPPPPSQTPPLQPPLTAQLTPALPGPRPMGSPRAPCSPRGTGSPRGPRSPRVRGAGSMRGSARGQLRNITNSTEGRAPRAPRGSGRGRGRGAAKMSQMVSNLNRPFQPFFPGPLPPHLQYGPGGIPTPASMGVYYGHDPSESIPEDLCMLGCVFYVTDYHKYLEAKEIDNWKQVIEQHGGQVDDSYSNRVTHVLCEHQKSDVFQLALRDGKRVVTAHWLNDCLVMKKMQPPWLVLHFPSPYSTDRPCKNQIITVTNFDGDERLRVKHMITVTGAKYTGYLTRSNSVMIAKRPEGEKYKKACDWRIPVVNVQWLNNLLLGDMMALKLPLHIKYQHFQDEDCFRIAEKWRVGHMLEGWKIPIKVSKDMWKRFNTSHFLKPAPPSWSEGALSQPDGATETTLAGGQKRKAQDEENLGLPVDKRFRPDDDSGSLLEGQHLTGMEAPTVLLTGIGRLRSDRLMKNVRKLGGVVTSHTDRCSHLVVDCIARTMKFFMAFSRCKYVVTPDWVTQSAKVGKFLDEADFLLKDEKAESLFNFNLQESLRRLREKKIFKDLSFHVTPSVKPNKQQLKEILESCGSRILDHRPNARAIASAKTPQGKPSIIVITCENDLHILLDLKRKNIGVHNAEFILTGLIRQEVDYNAYKYDF